MRVNLVWHKRNGIKSKCKDSGGLSAFDSSGILPFSSLRESAERRIVAIHYFFKIIRIFCIFYRISLRFCVLFVFYTKMDCFTAFAMTAEGLESP